MANHTETIEAAPLWRSRLALALSLLGLGIATYLTIAHFGHAPLVCSNSGAINCEKVTTSVQSYFLHIPVAVLGLGFYAAMTVLNLPVAWRSTDRRVHIARLGMLVLGMCFALYLVSAELLIIGAICLWCTGRARRDVRPVHPRGADGPAHARLGPAGSGPGGRTAAAAPLDTLGERTSAGEPAPTLRTPLTTARPMAGARRLSRRGAPGRACAPSRSARPRSRGAPGCGSRSRDNRPGPGTRRRSPWPAPLGRSSPPCAPRGTEERRQSIEVLGRQPSPATPLVASACHTPALGPPVEARVALALWSDKGSEQGLCCSRAEIGAARALRCAPDGRRRVLR